MKSLPRLFGIMLVSLLLLRGSHQTTPPELIYKWHLKAVEYKDRRQPFVPQYYGGFILHSNGWISWSDGCNELGSTYRIEAKKISINPNVTSTLIGCPFEIEDVHYEQATHYHLDGQTLFLHTPSQIYVLERFPYSRMSINPWSLYSIIDRKTGEVFNVDRFRRSYHNLFLRIENDESFRFTDLDGDEFTGGLRVEGNTIINMAYDQESQERLGNKPERKDYLTDNTQGYQKTKERYSTTYAHQVDWTSVRSFKVFEGTVRVDDEKMETVILEFYSDTQVYRFILR